MEALVLGRPGIERTRLEQILDDANIRVTVCHDGTWGCAGLHDACPLDGLTADVAIAVPDPSDRFDPQGIACVFRARIPIITVGATANDPVLQYSAKNLARVDRAVVGAARALATNASSHQRAIEEALDPYIVADENVGVSVRRSADSIDVMLVGDVDPGRFAALADIARAAVRAHDPRIRGIDVSVVDSTIEGV